VLVPRRASHLVLEEKLLFPVPFELDRCQSGQTCTNFIAPLPSASCKGNSRSWQTYLQSGLSETVLASTHQPLSLETVDCDP
jgi:hypothetical protein